MIKGTAQGLTRIFTRQYLDITQAISWERGLLMALMPNQFKDAKRFDSGQYLISRLHVFTVELSALYLVCKNMIMSVHRSRLVWLPFESTIQCQYLLAMHEQPLTNHIVSLALNTDIVPELHLVLQIIFKQFFYQLHGRMVFWSTFIRVPFDSIDSLFDFSITG